MPPGAGKAGSRERPRGAFELEFGQAAPGRPLQLALAKTIYGSEQRLRVGAILTGGSDADRQTSIATMPRGVARRRAVRAMQDHSLHGGCRGSQ